MRFRELYVLLICFSLAFIAGTFNIFTLFKEALNPYVVSLVFSVFIVLLWRKLESGELLKQVFLATAFFLFHVIVFFWPAVLKMKSATLGDGGDAWYFIWNFWYIGETISSGNLNFFVTDYILYPQGTELYLQTFSWFNSLIFWFFNSFFENLILSYNLTVLISFVLTGVSTYLLVNYLTDDWRVSLIAGLAFTFAPYRMARALGHLNLLSVQWIPLYLLYLLKTLREDIWSNSVKAGLFAAITVLSSYLLGFFTLVFTGILLLYLVLRRSLERNISFKLNKILQITLIPLLAAILLAPILFPTLANMDSGSTSSDMVRESAPADYLLPSQSQTNYKELGLPTLHHTGVGSPAFLGYTILLFSLLSLLTGYRYKFFWFLSALVFFVLSLGEGNYIGDIIFTLPVFDLIQRPARFSVFVFVSLIAPFSHGLKYIMDKLESLRTKDLLFLVLLLLIVFEFSWGNYPATEPGEPSTKEFYRNLSKNGGAGVVLDIPLDEENHRENMYWQTVHKRKIVGGRSSRPQGEQSYISNKSYLDNIRNQDYNKLSSNLSGFHQALKNNTVQYVIVHKKYITEEGRNAELFTGLSKTFENEDIIAYRVYRSN